MRRLVLVLLGCSVLGWSLIAQAQMMPPPPRSTVYFQLAKEQWVKTKTARVVISINATASRGRLAKIRGELMSNLNRIAKSDWHFTSFNRSRDSSGLERIYAQAETRMPEHLLGGLYSGAESVSQPGSKYQISQIEFRPSLQEVEVVRHELRDEIYKSVYEELDRLNKRYPKQHYYVSDINFVPEISQRVMRRAYGRAMKADMMMEAGVQQSAPGAVTVSQKINMQVMVVVSAAIPNGKHENGA